MKPVPQRLEPIFSPRIWGARSLAPLFPEKTDLAEPLGEAWLTSVESQIATPEFRGKTLGKAWREMPAEWRGTQFSANDEFPLLVKFIFPTDMLSLQVHPDDAYASVHEKAAGGRGKTEMWYIVSAEPGAELLFGLKPGSNRQEFLERLKDQTLESIFQAVAVQAGDAIFVPPGTPHAIGPGLIVCEVQEYSDLTYRVYDYGRVDAHGKPRELHIDKALEVTNFAATFKGKTKHLPLPVEEAKVERSLLAACPFFATELWTSASPYTIPVSRSHFDLIVLLSGRGVLRSKDFAFPIEQGECWFLPASLEDCRLAPIEPSKMIRTYVPNLSVLREELRRGSRSASVDNTVFD
ncbi:MAG TPA: type I phosphomannose isomerase catalytic subunit [Candidatus Sulfotelmatobacter sp.]|nr:type I phosphomannose isomerase catalytic subunit [Candidatus Sulfotelmatobacter sp.]